MARTDKPLHFESKGIPRKNLRPLAGKPLIVHVLAAESVTRVVVSTDDDQITAVAQAASSTSRDPHI